MISSFTITACLYSLRFISKLYSIYFRKLYISFQIFIITSLVMCFLIFLRLILVALSLQVELQKLIAFGSKSQKVQNNFTYSSMFLPLYFLISFHFFFWFCGSHSSRHSLCPKPPPHDPRGPHALFGI